MAPTRREFLKISRGFCRRSGSCRLPSLAGAQAGTPAAAGTSPQARDPSGAHGETLGHGGRRREMPRRLPGLHRRLPSGPQRARDSATPRMTSTGSAWRRVEHVFPAEAHPGMPEAIRRAFRAGSLQPLREPALRAGLPHAGHLQAGGRDRDDGLPPLHRLPVLHGRLPLRGAKHELPRSPALHPQDQPGFPDPDQRGGGKMQLLRGAACPGAPSRLRGRLQGEGPDFRRSGRPPFGRPASSWAKASPSGAGRNWGRDRRFIIFCEDAVLEKALTGSRGYGIWVAFLLLLIATGFFFYLRQLDYGLGITGLSRDVSWGLYIAQFTFLVGVAASAVMLVLPYYLHDYKAFGKITILGEFLAVSAVVMCITFVFVDLGHPARVFNVLLYPSPELHPLLGHDRPERISPAQHRHRLDGPRLRAERHPAARLGEAPDLPLHPLGDQHPHRHGLHLRGSSGEELLADGHHGAAVSRLGLRLRPGPADPASA